MHVIGLILCLAAPWSLAAEPGATADPAATQQVQGEGLGRLSDIIAKVWRDNPEISAALQALEGTGYDVSAARAGYYPYAQVQVSAAENKQDGNSTLIFVQPLWSGGSTGAEVDQAKAQQAAAMADINLARISLGQQTLDAYFNAAMAQEQAIQWANYIGALKRLLASIERRSDEGVAPTSDVQTAVSRLRQAEAGAEANRALLFAARAQLASLMNGNPPALDWPDESHLLSDEEVEESIKRIDLHPERIRALTEVDLQESTARRARADLWPELSLQHRTQLEGIIFDPTNDDTTLLVLQFQTANGLRGLRGYRAEQQRVLAARSRVDATTQRLNATLLVNRAQLRTIATQLAIQQQAADASTRLVDSFMRQYEVGRKSWLEVLNAQREAHEILLQNVAVKRSYWLANCKLALDALYWHRLGGADTPQAGAN